MKVTEIVTFAVGNKRAAVYVASRDCPQMTKNEILLRFQIETRNVSAELIKFILSFRYCGHNMNRTFCLRPKKSPNNELLAPKKLNTIPSVGNVGATNFWVCLEKGEVIWMHLTNVYWTNWKPNFKNNIHDWSRKSFITTAIHQFFLLQLFSWFGVSACSSIWRKTGGKEIFIKTRMYLQKRISL